jgi:hypothetical protein
MLSRTLLVHMRIAFIRGSLTCKLTMNCKIMLCCQQCLDVALLASELALTAGDSGRWLNRALSSALDLSALSQVRTGAALPLPVCALALRLPCWLGTCCWISLRQLAQARHD